MILRDECVDCGKLQSFSLVPLRNAQILLCIDGQMRCYLCAKQDSVRRENEKNKLESKSPMTWQPIETYPHVKFGEGPEVLLYYKDRFGVGYSTWYCWWEDEAPEKNDPPLFYVGEWEVEPTHWAPLIAP